MRFLHITALIAAVAAVVPASFARDNGFEYRDSDHAMKLEAGTAIPVRAEQPIHSEEGDVDHCLYHGVVIDDVRDDNGRVVIPAGSAAEMTVSVRPNNEVRLDLASVVIRGERYVVNGDPKHLEADGIVKPVSFTPIDGRQTEGREVHLAQGTLLTFRLEHPLITGTPD